MPHPQLVVHSIGDVYLARKTYDRSKQTALPISNELMLVVDINRWLIQLWKGLLNLESCHRVRPFEMKGITLKLRVIVIKLVGISSADTDSSTALS